MQQNFLTFENQSKEASLIKAIILRAIPIFRKNLPIYHKVLRVLERTMPPILWESLMSIHDWLRKKSHSIIQNRLYHLEESYYANNMGLPADTMLFRPGIKLRIHHNSYISFRHACTAPLLVDEMNCFLEAAKEKNRLLDIGAHQGIFSLVFAMQDPAKKVLAVDASPIAFGELLYLINKNELHNITAVECAISDHVGLLDMHYKWENTVAGRYVVAAGTKERTKQSIINIPSMTGDSLCQQKGFEPDIIKIDVEGHEIKVLRGLKEIIKKYSPFIFLEVHPTLIKLEGDSTSCLEDFFDELGYSATLMSGDSFPLSSFRNVKCEVGTIKHLFLRPKEYPLSVP